MKKLFPIALVAVAAMTFTSCKKDYTCECQMKDGSTVVSTTSVTVHDTKSNAESKCNATAATAGMTISCAIK